MGTKFYPQAIDRALSGYRELVETLSAARTPEFPDPSVTMAQLRVLMLLAAAGEARMSDLVPQLGISLSTLSSLVDRLFESGYAQRREDPRDRRNVLVSLTAEGTHLLDSFQELGADHLRTLLAHLNDTEIETVNQAIDVLVAAARRLAAEEHS
jgi:DNA-binding MarR family transcriptional regulator